MTRFPVAWRWAARALAALRIALRPSWWRRWLDWFWIRWRSPMTVTDMANRIPNRHVPEWARDELEKAYGRVQNLTAAKRLWDRVFRHDDRRKCGGNLAKAWTPVTGLTVGLYCTARGTTADRALVEVAHALGFLDDRLLAELLDVLGEEPAERDPEKPHWDRRAGELRFRDVVVRRVPKIALSRNIVPILDAFEEDGWPPEIDDPLTSGGSDDRRRRAVETLNRQMLKPWMWFECNGDGTGFRWRAKPRRPAKKAVRRKRH